MSDMSETERSRMMKQEIAEAAMHGIEAYLRTVRGAFIFGAKASTSRVDYRTVQVHAGIHQFEFSVREIL